MDALVKIYEKLNESGDPRNKDKILLDPLFMVLTLSGYLLFTLKLGPMLMRNRKPLNIDRLIQGYNFVQVLACTTLFIVGVKKMVEFNYNIRCFPITSNPIEATLSWCCYLIKVFDLVDTVFFVLRKKYEHVSFLHVYHHSLTFSCGWMFAKYYPGGQLGLLGIVNTLVHVFMYFYYFLASLGPKYKKYLWWKIHITHIQLVQFAIIFVHSVQFYFIECDYPKWLVLFPLIQSSVFLYLFGNFYVKTYIKTKPKSS